MSNHSRSAGLKAPSRYSSRKRVLPLLLLLLLALLTTTVQAQPVNGVTPRIVGGVDASPSAYPWAAVLLRSNTISAFNAKFCGGTLIDDRWVLTAAHCVDNFSSPSKIEVSIGIADLRNIGSSERIAVNAIYVHPAYDTSTQDNDIALLELATPSSNTVLAIANNSLTDSIPVGGSIAADQMTIIGWGDTTATTTPPTISFFPNLLQETQIPLFDFAACNVIYNDGLTSNMICAGLTAGGKDTCQGDSGGPMLYFNSGDSTWYQTGITSFGNGCAVADNPGVYTRVANYLGWINGTRIFASAFPHGYQFGYHGVEHAATQTLTLNNSSGADITVTDVSLAAMTNFIITNQTCTSGSIANNSNCTISLQFQATGNGKQLDTLNIDLDTGTSLSGPVSGPVSGTVLAAISATALDEPARTWYSGGNANWLTDSIANSNGNTAMRSGSIIDNKKSAILSYVTGPSTLSFRWKASTELGFDFLNLYIDGVMVDGISGDRDWEQRTINLMAGEHRVAWVYEKDISVSDLQDSVWLDSINTPFSSPTGGSGGGGGGGGGGSTDLFLLLIVLIALASAARQHRAQTPA